MAMLSMTFCLIVIFQNVLAVLLLILAIVAKIILVYQIIPAKVVVRIANFVKLQIDVHRAMKAIS